jgi:hypothetical protein
MKQQGISLAGRLDRIQDAAREGAAGASNACYGVRRLGIASPEVVEPGSPYMRAAQPTPSPVGLPVESDASKAAGLPAEPLELDYGEGASPIELVRAAAMRVWQTAVEKIGNRRRLAFAGAVCGVAVIGLLVLLCRGGDGPLRPQPARGSEYGLRHSAESGLAGRAVSPPGTARTGRNSTGGDFESTKAARAALLYGDEGGPEQELVIQPPASPAISGLDRSAIVQETTAGREIIPGVSGDVKDQTKPESGKRYRSCPPGLVLNGVVRCPEGLLANISGRFVPVGGTVNNAVVVGIKEYSVEMEIDGQRFLLGINASAPPPARDAEKTKAEADSRDDSQPNNDQAAEEDQEGSETRKPSGSGTSESHSSKRTSATRSDHS